MRLSRLVVLLAGLSCSPVALLAEPCVTQSQMAAADRDGLLREATAIAAMMAVNNAEGIRVQTMPPYSQDFDGIRNAITNAAPHLSGATFVADTLWLLDASASKPGSDGSAQDVQFFCTLNRGAQQTSFNIPALPAGRYGLAMLNSVGTAEAWQIAVLMRETGGVWLLGGLFPRATVVGGHDGLWYWRAARDYAVKKQQWNAWVYFAEAQQLLKPVSFVSSSHLDALVSEQQKVAPAALSTGVGPDQPLVIAGAKGEVRVTELGARSAPDRTAGVDPAGTHPCGRRPEGSRGFACAERCCCQGNHRGLSRTPQRISRCVDCGRPAGWRHVHQRRTHDCLVGWPERRFPLHCFSMPLPLKSLPDAIRERRSTPSFDGSEMPQDDLRSILQAGLAAPSGYNVQPWRFVVVQSPEQKKRLRAACFNQAKVAEASVVIACCGDADSWRRDSDDIVRMGLDGGMSEGYAAQLKDYVESYLSGLNTDQMHGWLNKQVTYAATYMQLTAEVMGYDTAAMEGFEQDQVHEALRLPLSYWVVSLLAIGHLRGSDKYDGGRFDLNHTCFAEEFGKPLK